MPADIAVINMNTAIMRIFTIGSRMDGIAFDWKRLAAPVGTRRENSLAGLQISSPANSVTRYFSTKGFCGSSVTGSSPG